MPNSWGKVPDCARLRRTTVFVDAFYAQAVAIHNQAKARCRRCAHGEDSKPVAAGADGSAEWANDPPQASGWDVPRYSSSVM